MAFTRGQPFYKISISKNVQIVSNIPFMRGHPPTKARFPSGVERGGGGGGGGGVNAGEVMNAVRTFLKNPI